MTPVIFTTGGRFPRARPQLTFVAKIATKVDLRTRGTAVTRPIEDRLLFPLESPPSVTIT